ncbi:hypothetical protein [Candidatus Amarolinea dominans]|uniref:hypothetical protein n=1 Tax=Candidatus Amarolinea dominans TaxID=3140696 RepID=UPI0031CCD213
MKRNIAARLPGRTSVSGLRKSSQRPRLRASAWLLPREAGVVRIGLHLHPGKLRGDHRQCRIGRRIVHHDYFEHGRRTARGQRQLTHVQPGRWL